MTVTPKNTKEKYPARQGSGTTNKTNKTNKRKTRHLRKVQKRDFRAQTRLCKRYGIPLKTKEKKRDIPVTMCEQNIGG